MKIKHLIQMEVASSKFADKVLKKRYIIQAVIELNNIDKLSDLTEEQVKAISKAKSKEEVMELLNK